VRGALKEEGRRRGEGGEAPGCGGRPQPGRNGRRRELGDGADRWAPPFSRRERGRRWSGPAGKKWAASSAGPSRAGGKKEKEGRVGKVGCREIWTKLGRGEEEKKGEGRGGFEVCFFPFFKSFLNNFSNSFKIKPFTFFYNIFSQIILKIF
jgi:hypothetical protein